MLSATGGDDSEIPPTYSLLHDTTGVSSVLRSLAGDTTNPYANNAASQLLYDENGNVGVRFTSGQVDALLPSLQALGLQVTGSRPDLNFVEGFLPKASIPALQSLTTQGLLGALPINKPVLSAGAIVDNGDFPMQSNRVRATLPSKFDGTGVQVGVLSDSYNALRTAQADINSGDLPASVNVVQDLSPGVGTDEGRAMLQIVHDIAPGASLSFATAFLGEASFAQNIQSLANAGASVIVDDVGYLTEPMFQEGVIAQAVNTVTQTNGVTYFNANGNQSNTGYDSSNIRFTGDTIPGFAAGSFYDFDPTSGVDTRIRLTLAPGSVRLTMQWDDPFYTTSGVKTDLDMYLLLAGTNTVLSVANDDNIASQVPNEIIAGTVGGGLLPVDIMIHSYAGPIPGRIKFVAYASQGTVINEYGGSPTSVPHGAATGSIAVAAVPYYDQKNPENFTSLGPSDILFSPTGVRLASPEVRPTPLISAPDGANTTFFSGDIPQDADTIPNFRGTSAAAPHAAGVAALLKQANPGFTPAQMRNRLTSTAVDLSAPGYDHLTGYGLIDAYTAIYGPPVAALRNVFDGFESGALSSNWEVRSDGDGAVQVTTANGPATGSDHLLMHSLDTLATSSLNEAILHVNLLGARSAPLSFNEREFNDADNPMSVSFQGSENSDGVAFSVDGKQWYRLFSLTGTASTNVYQSFIVDLVQQAAMYGVGLSSDTRIKFQQYGNALVPAGGIAFDDIQIVGDAAPTVILPSGGPVYIENTLPIVISPNTSISDPDASSYNNATLRVAVTVNGSVDDRLDLRGDGFGAGQFGVIGSSVYYGGLLVGSYTPAAGINPLVVTFNGSATVDAVTAAARHVTFACLGENPSPLQRTVEFVVTDDVGAPSMSVTTPLFVVPVNDPPTLATIADQSVSELSPLSFTVSGTDIDTLPSALLYIATNLPAGATFDSTTRTFSWMPSESQGPGVYFVRFVVSDGTAFDDQTISITVAETNTPPVFAAIANQEVNERTPLTFSVSASDSDLPANTLVYSALNLPIGATFDPASRVFFWTPTEAQGPQNYPITFAVSDGLATTKQVVNVVVDEVNLPPDFPALPSQTVEEGTLLEVDLGGTDADLPANTLIFTGIGLPPGARVDSAAHVLSWRPSELQGPGVYTMQIIGSDGFSSSTRSLQVIVTEVNQPPVLAPLTDRQIDEGQLLSFALPANDPDIPRNVLTYSMTGLPRGATFDAGIFRWTPDETQGGVGYPLSFTVSDGRVAVTRTMSIQVNDNLRPDLLGTGLTVFNGSLRAGGTVDVSYLVLNPGFEGAGPFRVDFFLVGPSRANGQGRLVGSQDIAGLAAGASKTQQLRLTLPPAGDAAFTGDGAYYLTMFVDAGEAVNESIESNNSTRGMGLDTVAVFVQGTQAPLPANAVRMDRAYNPNIGYHFFTTSTVEFNNAVAHGYRDETTGQPGFAILNSPDAAAAALHRLYNPTTGCHYYTASDFERSSLVASGWRYEKDEGYVFTSFQTGSTEIFRLYNRITGVHLYTENAGMKDAILAQFPGIWFQHASLGYGYAVTASGFLQQAISAPAIAAEAKQPAVAATVIEVAAVASDDAPALPDASLPGLIVITPTTVSLPAFEGDASNSSPGPAGAAAVSEDSYSAVDGVFASLDDAPLEAWAG